MERKGLGVGETFILVKVYYDINTARSKVQDNSILLDVQ
jgi:hypothetical protein